MNIFKIAVRYFRAVTARNKVLELEKMSDHALNDIGLTRGQIDFLAQEAFNAVWNNQPVGDLRTKLAW